MEFLLPLCRNITLVYMNNTEHLCGRQERKGLGGKVTLDFQNKIVLLDFANHLSVILRSQVSWKKKGDEKRKNETVTIVFISLKEKKKHLKHHIITISDFPWATRLSQVAFLFRHYNIYQSYYSWKIFFLNP